MGCMKITIKFAEAVESDLYEVTHGEFGPIHVYDVFVWAQCVNGTWFAHKTFKQVGWYNNEDGLASPNRHAKRDGERFACKVEDRGFIDSAHWVNMGKLSPRMLRDA